MGKPDDTLTVDCRPELLTVSDLETFALASDRMGLSLACLIAAMESGEEIMWMGEAQQPCRNH